MSKRWFGTVLSLALAAPMAGAQTQTQTQTQAPARPNAQQNAPARPATPAAPAAPNPNAKQAPDQPAQKYGRDGQIDKNFLARHEQFVKRAQEGKIDLLFLGDSITAGWSNNEVWQSNYGPLNAANFGIGGDRTQHVLWRIVNGEIEGIKPKVAVLMIGTNNSGDNSVEEIAGGVKKIVTTLREKLPETKVLLLAIFPRGEQPTHPQRIKVAKVNELLRKLDDGKTVRYLDIGKAFVEPDGTISKQIMPDFLHLSNEGYQRWAEAMKPTLEQMMK